MANQVDYVELGLDCANVCTTLHRGLSGLTLCSQIELAINTHVIVSDTHAVVSGLEKNIANTHMMVSTIHQNLANGEGGSDSKDPFVSDIHTLHRRTITHHRLDSNQVSKLDR